MNYHIFTWQPTDGELIFTPNGGLYIYQDGLEWTIRKYNADYRDKPWKMNELYRAGSGAEICNKLNEFLRGDE